MGILYSLFGCTSGIVEGALQTSKSIKESKKYNFFVSEYIIEQQPKGLFKIEEAWEEKSWGYKVYNLFSAEKILLHPASTELLFTIDTTGNGQHTYANFSEWQIENEERTQSVGYYGGTYRFSLQNKPSPDTIKLVLLRDPARKREVIGTLTFIRKR